MTETEGFALVEVPVVALLQDERIVGYDEGVNHARDMERMLKDLQILSERRAVPPITRPTTRGPDEIHWPPDTVITEVSAIRRLHGLSAARVFHVYVALRAAGRRGLIQAFEYLEHYCGVEGYGGGG